MNYSMMSLCSVGLPDLSGEKLIHAACSIGFTGIDYTNRLLEIVPVREFRHRAEDAGLTIVGDVYLNNLLDPELSYSAWLDNMYRAAEEARELHCVYSLIPTPGRADLAPAESRRRWIEALRHAVNHTAGSGTTFLIESFAASGPASCFITSDDLLEAVQGAPGLALNFDNGNMAPLEDPAEGFTRCAPYVKHAHFKDWRILAGPQTGSLEMPDRRHYLATFPGQGDMQFAPVLEAMRQAHYEGFINVEHFTDNQDELRQALDYLRSL